MHVDNQIRDGHITIIVKKTKKGEILINWRTLKIFFKNFLKIIFEHLTKFCNFLATLHLCTKSDPKNEHPYCPYINNFDTLLDKDEISYLQNILL